MCLFFVPYNAIQVDRTYHHNGSVVSRFWTRVFCKPLNYWCYLEPVDVCSDRTRNQIAERWSVPERVELYVDKIITVSCSTWVPIWRLLTNLAFDGWRVLCCCTTVADRPTSTKLKYTMYVGNLDVGNHILIMLEKYLKMMRIKEMETLQKTLMPISDNFEWWDSWPIAKKGILAA